MAVQRSREHKFLQPEHENQSVVDCALFGSGNPSNLIAKIVDVNRPQFAAT